MNVYVFQAVGACLFSGEHSDSVVIYINSQYYY